jgi:hypothetical protein
VTSSPTSPYSSTRTCQLTCDITYYVLKYILTVFQTSIAWYFRCQSGFHMLCVVGEKKGLPTLHCMHVSSTKIIGSHQVTTTVRLPPNIAKKVRLTTSNKTFHEINPPNCIFGSQGDSQRVFFDFRNIWKRVLGL